MGIENNFKVALKRVLLAKFQLRTASILFVINLVMTILLIITGTGMKLVTYSYTVLSIGEYLYVGLFLPLYLLTKVQPNWLTTRGEPHYRRAFWLPVMTVLCADLLILVLLLVLPLVGTIIATTHSISFADSWGTWLGLLLSGLAAFFVDYFLLVLALVIFKA
ncbi:hypothetical protein [Loigolactobacillus zhaoyuanensis]|uniref:Uncharacterized protein n=1 Tax=Loigolactobacillus zhaoyuanensis TaxID=2486017 RepID=A0ABW8UEB4_9LACO|nr:hypothetical protein [Loigolactobacillus zhaoyuanensis]